MDKRQFFVGVILSSVVGAVVSALVTFSYLQGKLNTADYDSIAQRQQNVSLTTFSDSSFIIPEGLNFMYAAEKATKGVVHIRAMYSSGQQSMNPLEGFFRNPSQSSGSGVIISDDGHIVTNNHVVKEASRIEVVLNDNRSYQAKLVGTDPTTDLALLKIDAAGLEFVKYGNSDNVRPGEWVLAVGNPFDLNSTVTAGIVSAKARNIGILRDKNNLQIESFIQTDAAVNPGNSGGALVNLKGELVGINTAIATPTGNYTGYSFAVPVSLVKKVMDDLLEYGKVQRGLLGIRIGDVSAQLAESQGLKVVSGVFVTHVNDNSAAEEAGIESGDVIIAIDNIDITNVSELQELVARNRPGDEIEVTYIREGSKKQVAATLKNFEGETTLARREVSGDLGGATLEPVSQEILKELNIKNGLRIGNISPGKWQSAGVPEGFIITMVDKVKITSIEELHSILQHKNGGILVEGYFPDGERGVYGMDW